MATIIMKLTLAEGMLVRGTRKEVEAEAPHLEKIGQLATTLGGNPRSRTYLVG